MGRALVTSQKTQSQDSKHAGGRPRATATTGSREAAGRWVLLP